MVRLLVLWNFGSLARWVRGSIPPLTIHCTILVAQSSPIPLRQERKGKERLLSFNLWRACYFGCKVETQIARLHTSPQSDGRVDGHQDVGP